MMDALQEAQLALAGTAQALSDDANPCDAIEGFDSLATVEVTTTICVTLGISKSVCNPFMENNSKATIAEVVQVFCSLSGASEN
ncbi:hypothetical protein [Sorangium sp. So ce1389]|uniref:hypothetical protein n=1 Tax=Sorangium sp. So ce1389 TaxID=3133336 RepID=UPI003F5F2007